MRLYSYLVIILLLANNATAECRDKDCMPEKFIAYSPDDELNDSWYFYYDAIFNIGSNWFVIVESDSTFFNGNITIEFGNSLSKSIEVNLGNGQGLTEKMENASVSFSGSSFSEEEFNRILYINFTEDSEGPIVSFQLKIHINKPPAEDMLYLWGGMTVFWLSIGLYVLYISNKFRELSDKIGVENNGAREKN